MIELLSISGENFVTFKNFELDLAKLPDNLLFIAGDNKDVPSMGSNGSGKSLIFDLISWINYGQTIRGLKADEVIGQFDKAAIGKMVFDDAGQIVTIRRKRTKGSTRLQINVDGKDQGGTNEDLQSFIDNWLMPFVIFKNAILMGQGDVNRFAELTDANRKEIISSIAGLSVFVGAREKAKRLRDIYQKSFEKFKYQMNMQKNTLDNTIADFEELKTSVGKKKIELETRLSKESKERREKILESKGIEEKILLLIPVANKITTLSSAWDKYRGGFDKEIKELGKKVYDKEKLITIATSRKYDFQVSLAEAERQLNMKSEELVGTVCSECGMTVLDDNVTIFRIHQKEVIEKSKKEINVQIDKEKNAKLEADKFEEEKDKLLEEKKKLENNYNKDRDQLRDKLASLSHFREIKSSIDKDIVNITNRMVNLEQDIKETDTAVKQAKDLVVRYTDALGISTKKAKDIQDYVDICDYWYQAFGPKGIPGRAMLDIAEAMSEKIGEVLEYIVDGDISLQFVTERELKSGGSATDFDIIIQDNTKPKPLRFALWSGGEKERIAFAIVITLMNLVSGKINLLLIEEALDINISDIGVSRILDYIRTLNNRILLVSHKPTVASYFSTKLLVTRHNGESKAIIV